MDKNYLLGDSFLFVNEYRLNLFYSLKAFEKGTPLDVGANVLDCDSLVSSNFSRADIFPCKRY